VAVRLFRDFVMAKTPESPSPRAGVKPTEKTPSKSPGHIEFESIEINLRDPVIAAVLAWVWPGLGHIYQRRYAKGALFMTCITTLFFAGVFLGGGRSVAAFDGEAIRARKYGMIMQFAAQFGCGGPSFPAIVQQVRVSRNQTPLWRGFMAPYSDQQLSDLHKRYGAAFDIGILYTMVAGLLNMLVIFDAFGGPLAPPAEPQKGEGDKSRDGPADSPPGSSPPGDAPPPARTEGSNS
jgi:hypothetical protein